MATELVVPTSIWRHPEFGPLTGTAKLTYLLLLTNSELSQGGIITARVAHWSRQSGMDAEAVAAGLGELGTTGWTVTDPAVDEVFVSGFFESQHVPTGPTRVVAARDAIAAAMPGSLAVAAATTELDALLAGLDLAPRGIRAI